MNQQTKKSKTRSNKSRYFNPPAGPRPAVVPAEAFEGLQAIRRLGLRDSDRLFISGLAIRMGYLKTGIWVKNHPIEYATGTLFGFVAEEVRSPKKG